MKPGKTANTEIPASPKLSAGYIFLGLLILSVGLNAFLYYKVGKLKPQLQTNEIQNFKWLSPHLNDIAKEDRLVHFAPLKTELISYINTEKDVNISVYFEYLITGTNFSINVDYYTYPASLTKVPISIMILNKVNKGVLKMEDRFPVTKVSRDSYSGDMYKYPDGTTFTLKELLEANIIKSDNTAKNILYSLIKEEDINDLINELGVDKLFNAEGNTTAKEYARVFRSLYYASMLTKEDSEYLLDLLTKTDPQKYMTAQLPKDVIVAHKYASMKPERSFSDVGIVFIKNRPFLLAVTIDGRNSKTFNEDSARRVISTIAKKSYDYVTNR
ncbi:serine hydrolase [candidate division WWE3 bacterium]|uniref:Serine hydrolase n=1 Tax=candidate division WWE3 bacterium TaxID=2053526 RepID=A0A7X9DKR0_UNCKA|nr:serine hydrolase [candidate division WWE3 bacterium]